VVEPKTGVPITETGRGASSRVKPAVAEPDAAPYWNNTATYYGKFLNG